MPHENSINAFRHAVWVHRGTTLTDIIIGSIGDQNETSDFNGLDQGRKHILGELVKQSWIWVKIGNYQKA